MNNMYLCAASEAYGYVFDGRNGKRLLVMDVKGERREERAREQSEIRLIQRLDR